MILFRWGIKRKSIMLLLLFLCWHLHNRRIKDRSINDWKQCVKRIYRETINYRLARDCTAFLIVTILYLVHRTKYFLLKIQLVFLLSYPFLWFSVYNVLNLRTTWNDFFIKFFCNDFLCTMFWTLPLRTTWNDFFMKFFCNGLEKQNICKTS